MATQVLRETLPDTMQAVAISEPGGPQVLRIEPRPVPLPRAGEVLVAVSHAGINRPDALQREGRYPPPQGAPDIPGLEISGQIVAVGEGVASSRLGQTVCALVAGGGYAQYCRAHAEHCLEVPAGLSLAEAAALPETLFTVWHNLFERGAVRDGETVLVHGGTSGIGTMAIKLGKLFGLRMIVTCGSDEKCAAALAIGADHAINYKTQDFAAEVRSMTDGKGADCVLDMVAGDYTQRNLDCLAHDGRLVTIAVLGGAEAQINMAKVMVRRHTLTGSTLRIRSDAFKAALAREIADTVWPSVADGSLRPEIDRIYPLAQAAAAHDRLESGEHVGKLVLEVGE